MNINDYLQWAQTKEKPLPTLRDRALHAYIGLVGEVGEYADWLKKSVFYDQELNVPETKRELGDLCFYSAILVNLGKRAPIPEILEFPIQPLKNDPFWFEPVKELSEAVARMGESLCTTPVSILPQTMGEHGIFIFSVVKGVAHYHSWTFAEILEMNVCKLDKRHPAGFTAEGARAKVDTTGE